MEIDDNEVEKRIKHVVDEMIQDRKEHKMKMKVLRAQLH